jgi:hypothetical protein
MRLRLRKPPATDGACTGERVSGHIEVDPTLFLVFYGASIYATINTALRKSTN